MLYEVNSLRFRYRTYLAAMLGTVEYVNLRSSDIQLLRWLPSRTHQSYAANTVWSQLCMVATMATNLFCHANTAGQIEAKVVHLRAKQQW